MVLDFKDEGCEIASEQLNNIFDPLYFSKKDSVGLGLSIRFLYYQRKLFLKKFFKFLAWAYDGSFLSRCATSLQKNTRIIKYADRFFVRNL